MKLHLSWYHRTTGGMPQSADYTDIGIAQQQFLRLALDPDVHGLNMWVKRG